MNKLRLGAVAYLNARPLVYGLDGHAERIVVRFDVPSLCASLLHENQIDLGLIPSIEYLRGSAYRIVPDIAIASEGPVASVALFSTRPVTEIRSIALDDSSRTSVALLHILCKRRFNIQPRTTASAPNLESMIRTHDAALLIGDPALYAEPNRLGLIKTDLGEEWTSMTGLPFVWAFWAGRPGLVTTDDARLLQTIRDDNLSRLDAVATDFLMDDPEKALRGGEYLRNNIRYHFGERESAGLRTFYAAAAELGLVPMAGEPQFYR